MKTFGASGVRELERRVRELGRLLGHKTTKFEIPKEALDVVRRRFAMEAVAHKLAVAPSNASRAGARPTKQRRAYRKAADEPPLVLIVGS